MKLLIHIGPDTLAVDYKSKASARRAIRNVIKGKIPKRKDNLQYAFKGRRYNWHELNEAVVLTLNQFHANCINK